VLFLSDDSEPAAPGHRDVRLHIAVDVADRETLRFVEGRVQDREQALRGVIAALRDAGASRPRLSPPHTPRDSSAQVPWRSR
jgi:hypothetical protein